MNDKPTLEERAEAVLNLIESDFCQSGRNVRFMAIRDELKEAEHQGYLRGLKEAGEIVRRTRIDDGQKSPTR